MDYTNGFLQCKFSLGPLRWSFCKARVKGQWGLKVKHWASESPGLTTALLPTALQTYKHVCRAYGRNVVWLSPWVTILDRLSKLQCGHWSDMDDRRVAIVPNIDPGISGVYTERSCIF